MSWAYAYRAEEVERLDPPHFVGRSVEMAFVQALVDDAAVGRGSVSAFIGARGVGKSRLLSECARTSGRAVVLPVQCGRALAHHQVTAQLARLLNISADRPNIAAAIESALAGRSKRRAVVILIDDVHLAAPAERKALEWLAELAIGRGMMVVGAAAADVDVPGRLVSLAPLPWRRPHAQIRILSSLDDAATEFLVRGLLHTASHPIATDTMREILDTAQGNPRFAEELVECAIANVKLIPATASEMMAAARARLTVVESQIVVAASVVGDPFRSEWVAKIAKVPAEVAADALQMAVTLGIVAEGAEGSTFSFRRAAVRKAFAASLITPKRRSLHERAAAVLSSIEGDARHAAMVAKHYDILQDDARATQWLMRAAKTAVSKGELSAAADLYARAAQHCAGAPVEMNEARRGLIVCYRRLGEWTRIIPVLESVLSTLDPVSDAATAGDLLVDLCVAHLNNGDRDAARLVVERVDALHLVNAKVIVNATMALSLCYSDKLEDARRCLRGIDPSLLDDTARIKYLIAKSEIGALDEPLSNTLRMIDEATEIAQKIGVNILSVSAADVGAEIALRFGDLATSRDYVEKAMRLNRTSQGDVTFSTRMADQGRVRLAFLDGDLHETRKLFDALMGWHDAGEHNEAFRAGIGVMLGMHTGDSALVDALFDPALLARSVAKRNVEACALLLYAFAEIMQVRGMEADLRRAIEECVAEDLVDPYIRIQHCAVRFGSAACAKRASEQATRYFRGTVAPAGPAHMALLNAWMARRFGTHAAAVNFAKIAARRYHQIGWRLYEAAALELQGSLPAAAETFAACGASYDAARLAAGRTRKQQRARFGARLTPRELEVMRLILRGRTNGDVASALRISIRTVHHHVEASFSKLGIRGRWQLTDKHLEVA